MNFGDILNQWDSQQKEQNKKNTPKKLDIKKACPNCGKHTTHKEKK